jgi:phosphatidylglycerol phospholipase C
MPRLADLLAYLAQPENEDIWVLLDIKRDDDAKELLTRVASTISSIQPFGKPWKDRIILGPWDVSPSPLLPFPLKRTPTTYFLFQANYISLCTSLLPSHPQAYISFSLFASRKLLSTPSLPNLNFNILLFSLLGPGGNRFLRSAKQAGRNVFVWTVNQEQWMEWCIRKGVDGVITDDPKLFKNVCERWGSRQERRGWRQWGKRVVAWGIMALLTPAIWMQYRPGVMTRRLVATIQGV